MTGYDKIRTDIWEYLKHASDHRLSTHLDNTDNILETLTAAGIPIGEMVAVPDWQPIETALKDGTKVWVYVAAREGLPAFQCWCAWHPDAGWCADELRLVTHWRPMPAAPKETEHE